VKRYVRRAPLTIQLHLWVDTKCAELCHIVFHAQDASDDTKDVAKMTNKHINEWLWNHIKVLLPFETRKALRISLVDELINVESEEKVRTYLQTFYGNFSEGNWPSSFRTLTNGQCTTSFGNLWSFEWSTKNNVPFKENFLRLCHAIVEGYGGCPSGFCVLVLVLQALPQTLGGIFQKYLLNKLTMNFVSQM
jgi:hypothetical protein